MTFSSALLALFAQSMQEVQRSGEGRNIESHGSGTSKDHREGGISRIKRQELLLASDPLLEFLDSRNSDRLWES